MVVMCGVLLTVTAQAQFMARFIAGFIVRFMAKFIAGFMATFCSRLPSPVLLKKEIIIGAAKPILKPVAYDRAWQSVLGIFLHLLIL